MFSRVLNKLFIIAFVSTLYVCEGLAQEERRDSLEAASVYADRIREEAGTRVVKPADLVRMPCVVGTADAVKFVQTLPGVSTGAEGSSAIYVRGGNLGNNLITLDGVPIYGSSHLLGFTSVYSPDIVSDVLFQVGGFTSDEGNLTSSHISVSSLDGAMDKFRASVSASNFLLGAEATAPIIKDRLSMFASVRVSPVGAELNAVKGLSQAMDSISNIKAAVYDVFGKFKWRVNKSHHVTLSVFNSLDSYGYNFGTTSEDRMRWGNLILNGSHDFAINSHSRLHSSISYNSFSSYQGMRKILAENANNVAMQNLLSEWTAQSTYSNTVRNGIDLQAGLKARKGKFAPGSSTSYTGSLISPLSFNGVKDAIDTWLVMAHAQAELSKSQCYMFRLAGRLNHYSSHRPVVGFEDYSDFTPEASLLARVNVSESFGFEATADWTAQYYHTLEGIPLGWSLDMIVPADDSCGPEVATQYYAGMFFSKESHSINVGWYYKEMRNLTYFAEATELFNTAASSWFNNIKTGSGRSYGLEALYEVVRTRFKGRVAYTLSKTDRLFRNLNEGERFPARFDRRHILNINAEYTIQRNKNREIGINTFFTAQSGHHVNIPAWEYVGELLPNGEDKARVDYYAGENAMSLPSYIRWDIGGFFKFGIGTSHPWTLNAGIYNVLNRHNIYGVTYNTEERKWKKISLFPIMPSLGWRIEF